MSPSSSSAIRILLIHDTQNEAEPIANAIRNSGQAVRSHFIASVDELSSVIEEQTWDIMLAKLNTATLDATEAVETVQREGKDIPIIGLIDDYNADIISSALAMGIADVIVESSEQHVALSVKREFSALKDRRSLRNQRVSLRETEKRCQLLLESSVDAISYVHEGMHIYANPVYMDLFGYSDIEELQCIPLMDLVQGNEVNKLKETLKHYSDGHLNHLETTGENANGETFKIHMTFSEASYEGEPCTQIVIRKSESKNEAELKEKIRAISHQDLVTGLYNRVYFNEQLDQSYQQAVTQGKRQIVSHIGIANLDEIKISMSVADIDNLLKQVGDQLQGQQPENTTLAHYSDGMFAMIYHQLDLENAEKHCLSTLNVLQNYLFEINNKTYPVDIVFGLAHIDESCKDGNEALVHADMAFNQAVKDGKRIGYFDKSDIANLMDNSIIAKIGHALEHNGMRVQFQPIMSLRGDSQEHYDILVRLKDKDGEDISPKEFLPAIEHSELSGKLDRWVVQHCVESLAEHRKRGNNTQLLIHLTAVTIQDPTFLPWVNSLLKKTKLPGDSLCFQISEDTALSYLKVAKAFSKGLSLLKCQLSINNFGMARDAFSLTKHLSIEYARIHPSFVDQLLEEGQASEELANLLKEIHNNNINSIIPKIENAEVLASLWELGVNYIQGYYLQAPLDDMEYNFDSEEDEAV
jgi:diguanylate cyclase (GGDEF)-like protein/PAS domain S-box-containing protein